MASGWHRAQGCPTLRSGSRPGPRLWPHLQQQGWALTRTPRPAALGWVLRGLPPSPEGVPEAHGDGTHVLGVALAHHRGPGLAAEGAAGAEGKDGKELREGSSRLGGSGTLRHPLGTTSPRPRVPGTRAGVAACGAESRRGRASCHPAAVGHLCQHQAGLPRAPATRGAPGGHRRGQQGQRLCVPFNVGRVLSAAGVPSEPGAPPRRDLQGHPVAISPLPGGRRRCRAQPLGAEPLLPPGRVLGAQRLPDSCPGGESSQV